MLYLDKYENICIACVIDCSCYDPFFIGAIRIHMAKNLCEAVADNTRTNDVNRFLVLGNSGDHIPGLWVQFWNLLLALQEVRGHLSGWEVTIVLPSELHYHFSKEARKNSISKQEKWPNNQIEDAVPKTVRASCSSVLVLACPWLKNQWNHL